jgi:hypothetical protein
MIKKKIIGKIILAVVLIVVVLYLLVWSGNVRCSNIPGMCSIYWGTQSLVSGKSQPSIMIAYDPNDLNGLGNPELLQRVLEDQNHLAIHPNMENINYLSKEKLKGISLIIVEKSKKLSTSKLEMFMDYLSSGGRLVWIGDAGTEIDSENDKLLTVGDVQGTYDTNIIGGWARLNYDNYMIRFDELICAQYIDNYCNIKNCKNIEYKSKSIGNKKINILTPEQENGVLIPTQDNPFTYAMVKYLNIKDNFSIVKGLSSHITPLKLDYGSILLKKDKTAISNSMVFPLIIISNSNRLAYYAIPPEYLIESTDEKKYYSVIENMVDSMLK